MNGSGYLITFEGGEGVGKSTQIELLKDRLKSEGYIVSDRRIMEPGTTRIGSVMRALLKGVADEEDSADLLNPILEHLKEDRKMNAYTQLCLFMASRSELYEKIVTRELSQGKIVIIDRSVDSSTVYQGHAQNVELLDLIRQMNGFALGGNSIDLTILLDLEVDTAINRISGRNSEDVFDNQNEAFHRRIRDGYLAEAKKYPDRIHIFSAAEDVNCIHKGIWDLVRGRVAHGNVKKIEG